MDRNVYKLCLFGSFAFSYANVFPLVVWELTDAPITDGENAKLKCNIPCVDNDRPSVVWTKENGDSSALSNGLISSDEEKYIILTSIKSCVLEIVNFSYKDLNINYTCSCGFDRYSRNLTLDNNSFERQPDTKDIHHNICHNDGQYVISVTVNKTFPKSECFAAFALNNSTDKMWIHIERTEIYYNTLIDIRLNDQFFGRFEIKCRIGRKTHTVFAYYFPEIVPEKGTLKAPVTALITLCALLFLLVIVMTCVLIKYCNATKSLKKKLKDQNKDKKQDEPSSTLLNGDSEPQLKHDILLVGSNTSIRSC